MSIRNSEVRKHILQDIVARGGTETVENILRAGFPASAAYPSYWYSTSPGARLATKIGCRVIFSRKEMTITLEPMSQEFASLQELRFAYAKDRARERSSSIMEFVRRVDEELNDREE